MWAYLLAMKTNKGIQGTFNIRWERNQIILPNMTASGLAELEKMAEENRHKQNQWETQQKQLRFYKIEMILRRQKEVIKTDCNCQWQQNQPLRLFYWNFVKLSNIETKQVDSWTILTQ